MITHVQVQVLSLAPIKFNFYRGIAQLVARLSGGQEVVSSSLATPTKVNKHRFVTVLFFKKKSIMRRNNTIKTLGKR